MGALLELQPDIAVIAECAHPEVLRSKAPALRPSGIEWMGENRQKGLAVFTFGDVTLTAADPGDEQLRYFLPVRINAACSFNLLATWAFAPGPELRVMPNSPTLHHAVERYDQWLSNGPSVMAGDFNAGVMWDGQQPEKSFRALDGRLRALGLRSAIHEVHGWDFGDEKAPTFFDRTRKDMPFHIDYVYVRQTSGFAVQSATIGRMGQWRRLSDHMPLVVDLTFQGDVG